MEEIEKNIGERSKCGKTTNKRREREKDNAFCEKENNLEK